MFRTLSLLAMMVPILVGSLHSQEILHFEPIVDFEILQSGELYPPVFVAFPPGESNEGFLVSLGGEVRGVDMTNGELNPEPFLVVDDLSEEFTGGLYSMAFHPNYQSNGRLYVCYTAANNDFLIQEYLRQSSGHAIAGRRIMVLDRNSDNPADSGGWMGFGPDGYLYVSVGGGLTFSNRPDLGGTVIRIDVDGDDFPDIEDLNYAIPLENPLIDTPGFEEVIAAGLKNAWRCSFDSKGNLFIGSLGSVDREEIELFPADYPGALNFGFPCFEGSLERQDPATCDFAGLPFTLPIFEYGHTDNLSGIVGGYVVERDDIPELTGRYIYADLRDRFHVYSLQFDGTKSPGDFNGRNVNNHRLWRTSVPVFDFGSFVVEWFSFSQNGERELFVISGLGGVYRLDSIREAGDFNGDDEVNLLDVAPFVDAMLEKTYQGLADINYDFEVDFEDIVPFVELIQNGN